MATTTTTDWWKAYQDILNSYQSTSITPYEERYKQYLKQYQPTIDEETAAAEKSATEQSEAVKNNYQDKIQTKNEEYNDLSEKNAVQKLINEKQLESRMSDMGLTDSGLNRTQQTALQISYANQEQEINKKKTEAVNLLRDEMNSKLDTIESNKESTISNIKSTYEKLASDAASETYKTDVNAAQSNYDTYVTEAGKLIKVGWQEETKANNNIRENDTKVYTVTLQEETKRANNIRDNETKQYKITKDAETKVWTVERQETTKENNNIRNNNTKISIATQNNETKLTAKQLEIAANEEKELNKTWKTRYILQGSPSKNATELTYKNSEGKTMTVKAGVNPTTGTMNDDVKTNGVYDSSKAMSSNRYQPNNIGGEKLKDTGKSTTIYNIRVTVWQTPSSGKLWVWDGKNNTYREYDAKSNSIIIDA